MNACVIYDNNTGVVALSPAEAASNVVRQGRNEAAATLRKEAERYGDEIEYVVYMGTPAYKNLERSNVTTLWKEFLKEPHPYILMGVAASLIFASGIILPWMSVVYPMKSGDTMSPWVGVAFTVATTLIFSGIWRGMRDDRSAFSHIKKFGFKKDFLPTARRYSRNMLGVGRDSLYVFAAPMSEDVTVNKIGYDQIQHVREQNGMLNIVSRGGQVIETIYSYESEYKGDVMSDIMNRHIEALEK